MSATGATAPRSTRIHSPPRWGCPLLQSVAPNRSVIRPTAPAPSLALTRKAAGAISRTGGADSANAPYAPPSALRGWKVKVRPRAAKFASSPGERRGIHHAIAGSPSTARA